MDAEEWERNQPWKHKLVVVGCNMMMAFIISNHTYNTLHEIALVLP